MQDVKNITLLTPAVLHSTALEYLTEQPSGFHRKQILRFGLMQGVWSIIVYITLLATTVFPGIAKIRETGETVLTHANFTQCSIANGQLKIDIKPAIWAFTLHDSDTQREEFVVDSIGTLNRFYWDDRVEKGMVKKVDGISLAKEYLFIKRGTLIRRLPYGTLLGNNDVNLSKGEIYERFMEMTARSNVMKVALLAIPIVFLLGFAFGILANIIYVFLIGGILRLMTGSFLRTPTHAYKIANGLYVGFAYVFLLALIAQQILFGTLADLTAFFAVVKGAALIATLSIGFLFLKSLSLRSGALPIPKIKRRRV
jgi:hypothetical protein